MTRSEKKDLLDILAQNYIYQKEQDKVWQREHGETYTLALGKLRGACMALKLDFEETDKDLTILTQNRRKTVTKIEKQ